MHPCQCLIIRSSINTIASWKCFQNHFAGEKIVDRSWWARTGTTTLSPAKMFQRAMTDIGNKMLCQGCQYRVTREMRTPGALTIAAEMKTRPTLILFQTQPRLSGHPPFIHNNITESGRFREWSYEDYNLVEESSFFRFTHLSFVDCKAGGFNSRFKFSIHLQHKILPPKIALKLFDQYVFTCI